MSKRQLIVGNGVLWKGCTALLMWLLFTGAAQAETEKQMLYKAFKKMDAVQDYQADIVMDFAIPGLNLQQLSGKVYYKKPDKFRIKTKGIFFLPKQNLYYGLEIISDTLKYTAINGGTELVNGVSCTVITVVPNVESDLLVGKFWVRADKSLIQKSQLTTKSNGTITIENTFGASAGSALPDRMQLTVDVQKFKVPKMVSMEINSKAKANPNAGKNKNTGTIVLRFSQYKINQKLKDEVFTDKE
jgi:hypothetical protein